MMMKAKSFMMWLALSGLAAGCSNDTLPGSDEEPPVEGRSEIQLSFTGSGESQDYERSARAIASESENKIENLSVYLFASSSENGTYYYLETWNDGTAYDPAHPTQTNFKKQESGTGWKASIYPNELKGLPYIKLLCVANNGAPANGTTDGKFYNEIGTEILNAMTPVEVDMEGRPTNDGAGGATTETEFRAAYTMRLDPMDPGKGTIATPLVMTGENKTKISGSVSKVNIELRRIVARFDIENTGTRSNLTITQITMAHGRKCGGLFADALLTKVEEADLESTDLTSLLASYLPVAFDKQTGANLGLTESALYVYPTLPTDKAYLVVEGTYKSPMTSEQVPVKYHIPIAITCEGTIESEYIGVKANSRYKLRITDVTQSNILSTFEVVDWTSGGGIITKPDNDAPVFAADVAFEGANKPTDRNAANPDATTYDYEVTGTDGNGNFDITISATGKVRAEKGSVVRATDWLTVGQPNYKEVDGIWYTTFNLSYGSAVGLEPVAVTFINESASYDPDLWTTINFYAQKAVPALAEVDKGHAKGNSVDLSTAPDAPTAQMYNIKNGYIQLDVTCVEGVRIPDLSSTGYKVEEVKTTGYVHTYKISVADEAAVAAGDEKVIIKFQNAGVDAGEMTQLEKTLTITRVSPALKFIQTGNDDNAVTWVEGTKIPYATTGELKIDLDALKGVYTFKLDAPLGLKATTLANCPWLNVAETHEWQDVNGERYAGYSITAINDPASVADYKLVFNNNLNQEAQGIKAPNMVITVHKDFSKPKLAAGTTTSSWSTFNVGLDADFATDVYASTIEMYKVANSTVTVKMTCTEAASFEDADGNTSGVKVERIGKTDEYKISVTDATKLTSATTEVIAHTDDAYAADNNTDRKAKLTIIWKDPAITITLADGNGITKDISSSTDAHPVYTVDTDAMPGAGFTFTVTANGGAIVDLSTLDDAFLTKGMGADINDTTLTAGSTVTYKFKGGNDKTDDITIVFTNTITGGGDLTITFKKAVTPP